MSVTLTLHPGYCLVITEGWRRDLFAEFPPSLITGVSGDVRAGLLAYILGNHNTHNCHPDILTRSLASSSIKVTGG